jgi:DNA (cytosine-5)-methyltransferase 1
VSKLLSLYTGAGGLDYGFESAGFELLAGVEFDPDCYRTLAANRESWRERIFNRSILEVTSEDILSCAELKPGEADILIGGPPCQPFSKSGYWAKGDTLRLSDPRAQTLGAYLRVLEDAQPAVFLLENVEGLNYSEKNEGRQLLEREVARINKRTGCNYRPVCAVLNAADYGVPQLRYRFFMVAHRDGKQFVFPRPTHAPTPEQREAQPNRASTTADGDLGLFSAAAPVLEPYRTAWDALHDLGPDDGENVSARGKWADLLPSIPEGRNYLWHTDRGGGKPLFGWRRRFWNFLLKLGKNLPSWTVQAQPGPAVGPFHWQSRRLSWRELAAIQTFPRNISFTGNRGSVQKQIGNAVPSLLGEVLGREIRVQLLGLSAIKGAPKLLPARKTPVPAPEPLGRVPKKYLHLVGEHEAHPGTGKGYAAVTRAGLAPLEPAAS